MKLSEAQLRSLIGQVIAEANPKKAAKRQKTLSDTLAHEAVVVLHNDFVEKNIVSVENALVDILDEMLAREETTDGDVEKCTVNSLRRVDWEKLLVKYMVPNLVEAVDAACARISARRAVRQKRPPVVGGYEDDASATRRSR